MFEYVCIMVQKFAARPVTSFDMKTLLDSCIELNLQTKQTSPEGCLCSGKGTIQVIYRGDNLRGKLSKLGDRASSAGMWLQYSVPKSPPLPEEFLADRITGAMPDTFVSADDLWGGRFGKYLDN